MWEDAAFKAHNQDIDDVTIRNLVIRNMPNRGIHAYQFQSDRWTIEFNEITATSVGVAVPNNSLIRNNYIHHNTKGAYMPLQRNTTFDHNEMAYNGIEHKVTGTTNFTFRNNFVHHNTRDGIWYDAENTGSLIEGNTVEDNAGEGILVEISGQGIVRNNASRRNGVSGIFISTSKDVEAYNNTIEDNFRGIIYFLNCGSVGKGLIGWDLRDDTVRDNIVKVGTGSGALANGLSRRFRAAHPSKLHPI